jgi:hypothetical protein
MKFVLASCVSLLALASCQSGLGEGPIDGRVYEVQLEGGAAPMPDVLVFDGARFESSACRPFGFVGGPYQAMVGGDATSFEATAKCDKSGTTAWSGKIHGGSIQGTLCWTDAAGKVTNMRFHGATAKGALDGRTFVGMICEGNKTTGDEDTINFSSGGFESVACRPYGFAITPYTTSTDGGATRFTATAINAGGDQNLWEGTLNGSEMTGTMKHMDASGKVLDQYRWIAHAK